MKRFIALGAVVVLGILTVVSIASGSTVSSATSKRRRIRRARSEARSRATDVRRVECGRTWRSPGSGLAWCCDAVDGGVSRIGRAGFWSRVDRAVAAGAGSVASARCGGDVASRERPAFLPNRLEPAGARNRRHIVVEPADPRFLV